MLKQAELIATSKYRQGGGVDDVTPRDLLLCLSYAMTIRDEEGGDSIVISRPLAI